MNERFPRPGGLLRETVNRFIKPNRSDVPHRARFKHIDEFGIHGFVTDTVSDDVDPRAHNGFGVIEIVDVGGDPQPVLVRLIDDRGIDFRLFGISPPTRPARF